MDQPRHRKWDHLIINAHLATMVGPAYGAIENAALAIANGRIAWLGRLTELPAAPQECARRVTPANRMWLTPGLVDCQTHLMFGEVVGRDGDPEHRVAGARTEAERAAALAATLQATRQASESALIDETAKRLRHYVAEGVTTIEIKTGYGLDAETELRMLRAIHRLDDRSPLRVIPTFFGTQAVPPEFSGRPEAYHDKVCQEVLPALLDQHLTQLVDVVLDPAAGLTEPVVARLLEPAIEAGLRVRLQADRFADDGGCALAARYEALSAAYLEHASPDGVRALAPAGSVAVLLPGDHYFGRRPKRPPIEALRDAGVAIAVATDANPMTSPLSSLITAMNLACTLFDLTAVEALRGVTIHAAAALGRDHELGSLEVGKLADLALWEIDHPAALCEWIGGRRCRRAWVGGEEVF